MGSFLSAVVSRLSTTTRTFPQNTMSSGRPDAVTSSGPVVKDEPADDCDHDYNNDYSEAEADAGAGEEEDDDDPIVRTIDVYISPALAGTLRLLQFPIEPAHRLRHRSNLGKGDGKKSVRDAAPDPPAPTEARFRPRHNMLELEYPLPPLRRDHRPLPDKVMRLTSRTYCSNSVAPRTHMALARLDAPGGRLDVIPLRDRVLQMRPSFGHLHDGEDDGESGGGDATSAAAAANDPDDGGGGGGGDGGARRNAAAAATTVMFARRETERSDGARRSSYAHKRASEAGEGWVELDVHVAGTGGRSSRVRGEALSRVRCGDVGNHLMLAGAGGDRDGDDVDPPPAAAAAADGSDDRDSLYVRSLNYLDPYPSGRGGGGGGGGAPPPGDAFVENLSEWAPSPNAAAAADGGGGVAGSAAEMAAAELAAKIAVLMQNGNGTMIPYCVLRSRFHPARVPDEMLTVALSSCAVLVRGNFALRSNLAKFLASTGGGKRKLKLMREMRDVILLLLNMHGMVQRERLARAYSSRGGGGGGGGYDPIIDPDAITFVLATVARKSHDCWVAKVDDDEEFAARFPEVAALHAIYWMKKKEMLGELLELYESVESGDPEC